MEYEGHYCVHIPPLVPILKQLNPIHILKPYFTEMHFNITLPFTPRSSQWFFNLDFLMTPPT